MTEDGIIAALSGGQCKLLLDTNALFGHRRLVALCDDVRRLNSSLAQAGDTQPICLYVSATAHAEKLFDLKQDHREAYNPGTILQGMQRKGLEVLSFESTHAETLATLLGRHYPERTMWHQAKKKRCLHCLGIKELGHSPKPCAQCGRPGTMPGSGKRCGATIDWLIAAHAVSETCILVTDDRGEEFKLVAQKVRLATLERALSRMLANAEERGQ